MICYTRKFVNVDGKYIRRTIGNLIVHYGRGLASIWKYNMIHGFHKSIVSIMRKLTSKVRDLKFDRRLRNLLILDCIYMLHGFHKVCVKN